MDRFMMFISCMVLFLGKSSGKSLESGIEDLRGSRIVSLKPCTNLTELFCVHSDTTTERNSLYLGDDISVSLIFRFPNHILAELLADQSMVTIVSLGGRKITTGQEVLRLQDRHRWNIDLRFQPIDSAYGIMELLLNISHLEYHDEQILHVEIGYGRTTFRTDDQIWLPGVDDVGQGTIEPSHQLSPLSSTSAADSLHILFKINELEKENADLLLKISELSHYQEKYIHCLESKFDLEEITNKNTSTSCRDMLINAPGIVTCCMFVIVVTAFILFFHWKLKKVPDDGTKVTLKPGEVCVCTNGYLKPKTPQTC